MYRGSTVEMWKKNLRVQVSLPPGQVPKFIGCESVMEAIKYANGMICPVGMAFRLLFSIVSGNLSGILTSGHTTHPGMRTNGHMSWPADSICWFWGRFKNGTWLEFTKHSVVDNVPLNADEGCVVAFSSNFLFCRCAFILKLTLAPDEQ